MILWAEQSLNDEVLCELAYRTARKWTGLVTGTLRLVASEKNAFIPEGRAAAAAQGEVDRLLSEAFTMPGKAASEAKQSVEQFAAERAREVERKREQLSRLK